MAKAKAEEPKAEDPKKGQTFSSEKPSGKRGPSEETMKLANKVVKTAGKRGKPLAEIIEALGLADDPNRVRRAIRYAVGAKRMVRRGTKKASTYHAV